MNSSSWKLAPLFSPFSAFISGYYLGSLLCKLQTKLVLNKSLFTFRNLNEKRSWLKINLAWNLRDGKALDIDTVHLKVHSSTKL